MTSLYIAAVVTFILSVALTRFMIYLHIADVPNERSSHAVATSKSGGVAIVLSLITFLVIANYTIVPLFTSYVLLLLSLAGLMGFIGILDDIYHLSYKPRLILQVVVALVMVTSGHDIDHIPLPGIDEIDLGVMGPVITIFWVVGFINAFNFMDGLNGMAAGGALMVSLLLLILMPMLNPFYFVFYGLIFALAGFLRYNFYFGRIFMSDVGSQFLGTLFAVATLMIEPVTAKELPYYVIPMLFLPFIWDASLTFIMRLYGRKDVFKPHKEFLFHRLVALGWSHTQTTLLYMGLILAQGGYVRYFLKEPSFTKLGLNFAFYAVFSLVIYKLPRPLYTKDQRDD
jgi:UDP-GlcNAc:undecaprenyl-phosphate/decaprenyl-phosphate GlcNAc-1-phosphate transferase